MGVFFTNLNDRTMKIIQPILMTALLALSFSINAQNITYRVEEADVDKYRGYIMPDFAIHLGGGTGAAIDVGAVAQYRLPVLPITLRGNMRWELIGVGKSDVGNTGVLDVGGMFPIIPGRRKDDRVKVITNYSYSSSSISESYFYVDGQKKADLLARAGLFQLISSKGLSTTGFSGGVAFRMIKHAKVRINQDQGYYYESNFNWQVYSDVMIAPVSNVEEFMNDSLEYGAKLGVLSTGQNWNWYAELCVYPKGPAYYIFGFLFDLGWHFK